MEGDPDITIAVNTPLPGGTDSPMRERSPEVEPQHDVKNSEWSQDQVAASETPKNCMI